MNFEASKLARDTFDTNDFASVRRSATSDCVSKCLNDLILSVIRR